MFPDWFFTTGFVIVVGYVGVLLYIRSAQDNDFLPPWEAYQRTLSDAQAARGQFLRKGLFEITKSLKDRICCKAQKWHIQLSPLCR
jgi:hypothetical protein